MGVMWDDGLYLLTPGELSKLPGWTLVRNINGGESKIGELDINNLDIRYGVTAWGIDPVEWSIYGEIVVQVKHVGRTVWP